MTTRALLEEQTARLIEIEGDLARATAKVRAAINEGERIIQGMGEPVVIVPERVTGKDG